MLPDLLLKVHIVRYDVTHVISVAYSKEPHEIAQAVIVVEALYQVLRNHQAMFVVLIIVKVVMLINHGQMHGWITMLSLAPV
jgi:hypothetical protein